MKIDHEEGQDTPEFQRAVETAKTFFFRAPSSTRLAFKPLDDFAPGEGKAHVLQTLGFRKLSSDTEKLLADARTNADAFNALRYGLAQSLALKQDIPDAARMWLVDYVLGRIEEPMRPSGRKKSSTKNAMIFLAVKTVERQGLARFRGDYDTPTSGCDAVAVALRELGMTPTSYSQVKKIFTQIQGTERPDGSFSVDY